MSDRLSQKGRESHVTEGHARPSNFINKTPTFTNVFDVETKRGQIKPHFTLGEVPMRDCFPKLDQKLPENVTETDERVDNIHVPTAARTLGSHGMAEQYGLLKSCHSNIAHISCFLYASTALL